MRSKYTTLLLILGFMVVFILIVLSIFVSIPSGTRYSVFNTGAMGESRLASFSADVLSSYDDLGRHDSSNTLLVTAAIKPWDERAAHEIHEFLAEGGMIIIYGDPVALKSDLSLLGLHVSIDNRTIMDPIHRLTNRSYPEIYIPLFNTTVYMHSPYLVSCREAEPLGFTSNLSYLDLDGNGHYDIGEPMGSFPVFHSVRVGKGYLFIASTDMFMNNYLVSHNKHLLGKIGGNRTLLVDQASVNLGLIDYLQGFKSRAGAGGGLEGLILLLTGVAAYFVVKYVKI